jgi:DNA-binding NarL/FixJ family response regulator
MPTRSTLATNAGRVVLATTALASTIPPPSRILQLVADGHADREVGRILGISTRTVHAHLQRIYRALDVTSRTEALARLRERSLTATARRARGARV